MAARKKMIFDEAALAHLKACRAQGMTMAQAAKEFGVKDETLRKYINDSPYVAEVKRMYPRFGVVHEPRVRVESGYRVISMDALKKKPPRVPNNPPAQWLARSWRKAA